MGAVPPATRPAVHRRFGEFDGGVARVLWVVGGVARGGFALGVWGVYCFLSRRVRNGKPEGVYGSVGGLK